MTQNSFSRVFLSDEPGLQVVGFGTDRYAAVRDGLDRLQKIVGDRFDYSEFRTFDVFPAWQINPQAFFAVENNSSEIDGIDGYGEEFNFENHPDSAEFVVLIDRWTRAPNSAAVGASLPVGSIVHTATR